MKKIKIALMLVCFTGVINASEQEKKDEIQFFNLAGQRLDPSGPNWLDTCVLNKVERDDTALDMVHALLKNEQAMNLLAAKLWEKLFEEKEKRKFYIGKKKKRIIIKKQNKKALIEKEQTAQGTPLPKGLCAKRSVSSRHSSPTLSLAVISSEQGEEKEDQEQDVVFAREQNIQLRQALKEAQEDEEVKSLDTFALQVIEDTRKKERSKSE